MATARESATELDLQITTFEFAKTLAPSPTNGETAGRSLSGAVLADPRLPARPLGPLPEPFTPEPGATAVRFTKRTHPRQRGTRTRVYLCTLVCTVWNPPSLARPASAARPPFTGGRRESSAPRSGGCSVGVPLFVGRPSRVLGKMYEKTSAAGPVRELFNNARTQTNSDHQLTAIHAACVYLTRAVVLSPV